MAFILKGKVAVVTGGASGIGACVVKRLVDEELKHVAIFDVAEELDDNLQCKLNKSYGNIVKYIHCDVTDQERLLEAFKIVREENGYIDIVINGAGIFDDRLESYVKEININLVALITSSLHAWNTMHKEKGGSGGTIINFGSVSGLAKTVNAPIYSATKSALQKFSTSLGDQQHYSKSGVRVITICFGVTITPMLKNVNCVFDNNINEQIHDDLKKFNTQSPETAANEVIEVYKRGESGSIWISRSDKPAVDVTDLYYKSFKLFDHIVYN